MFIYNTDYLHQLILDVVEVVEHIEELPDVIEPHTGIFQLRIFVADHAIRPNPNHLW